MRTKTDLYNAALAQLGGDQLPASLNPGDTSLVLCENNFPHVLDQALSAHAWSFARKRKELERIGNAPEGSGFDSQYALPDDLLKAERLAYCDMINRHRAYTIEGNTLLSNVNPVLLLYIARVDDPAKWPPAFANALMWGLAGFLASARINDSGKQKWCYDNYTAALAEAVARDMAGQNPHPPVSAWMAARDGWGG